MDKNVRTQWYDGLLYSWFFDSVEGGRRKLILDLIPEDSNVLDVCCGTGRLALEIAEKCRHVTAVDISPRMLAFAQKQKDRRGIRNVDFVYGDSTRLGKYLDQHYDVAVISLSLHEMGPDERHATVCAMSSVADRLIVADHTAPQPASIPGFFITQMERLIAGRLNWERYREFVASGGILGALRRCGLSPDEQRRDGMGIRHVVAVDNR
jgi:SAM-dependent methyltransferase